MRVGAAAGADGDGRALFLRQPPSRGSARVAANVQVAQLQATAAVGLPLLKLTPLSHMFTAALSRRSVHVRGCER